MSNLVADDDKERRLALRSEIDAYEEEMKAQFGTGPMEDVNSRGLQQFITSGAYTRVLDIPAGVTIVSKLWNRDRLWIIIEGEVLVKTELGDMVIEAPYVGEAPFGTKIALFAIKDTKWAAITGVETDDLSKVEEEIEAKSYSEFIYPWDLLEESK